MKNRIFLIFVYCFCSVIFISSFAFSDEFEDMKNAEMSSYNKDISDFANYRQQLLSEFEKYKKINDEEYASYKNEILNFWDKPEISTKKKYVQYSPDMKTKKKVDFEHEKIKVDIIIPKDTTKKNINKKIKKSLKDLIAENQRSAWKKDTVSQKIEKRLKKISHNVVTSKISNDPIISNVITGHLRPDSKTIDNAVSKLLKTAKVKSKPSFKVNNSKIVSIEIALPKGSMKKKAENYVGDVKNFSSKNKISPSLVMAVMQTESAFNPMARSYVPAYGLMQIVPKSAGLDASKKVFGKEVLLSPSFLYNGKNNIKMGTAFINILYYRYLKKIKNKTSRLYCTIAAYNTGAGNVARAFNGTTNIHKASKIINKLSPGQVYKKLLRKLPHAETKNYLKRVSKRIENYQEI